MYGPGSIHVAHTDHESVAIADLHRAVEDYQHIARTLLARPQGLPSIQ
jgi:acetylornithine deacetylase